jgi:predicted restriction endonuclease
MSSFNEPSLRMQVVSLNTGDVSIEQVPLGQIEISGKSVSELTDSQLKRLTFLYQKVGYVIDKSVEKWIKIFTYDLHPEREIQVWEEIGAVFDKYSKSHELTFALKQQVIAKLILIVGGEELNDSVSLELAKFLKEKQDSTFFIRPSQSQQPWNNIDYRMLAQIYNVYIERHNIEIQENTDDLFVTLTRLMEGNEPSTELGQELLEIWNYLEESESENEQDFDPDNISDERQKRSRDVVTRPGQAKFKSELMKAYGGCCAITGCSVEVVLQAAHIISYLGAKTDHPSNGLLLRVDIHQLFDSHSLSINPDTKKVEISSALENTCYEYLAGQPLRLPKSKTERPNPNALSKHYQIFSDC